MFHRGRDDGRVDLVSLDLVALEDLCLAVPRLRIGEGGGGAGIENEDAGSHGMGFRV